MFFNHYVTMDSCRSRGIN